MAVLIALSLVGVPMSLAAMTAGPSYAIEPTGLVTVIDVADGIEYLGGSFHTLGPPSGQGVPVGPIGGEPRSGYPRVTGTVLAIVADGDGGWIVGGAISAVDGRACSNVAWLRSSGRVGAWQPSVNGPVGTLLLVDRTLYLAGNFTAVNGASRAGLAAVDLRSGAVLPWAPRVDGSVAAMARSGSLIYLGGRITAVAGHPRTSLAAVDAVTGAAAAWAPQANGAVRALCVADSTVYVGGYFSRVNDDSRLLLAAVSATTGATRPFVVPITRTELPGFIDGGPFVTALAIRNGILYVGGSFTEAGGLARNGLCAASLETGAVTEWNPSLHTLPGRPAAECWTFAFGRGAVYFGGLFDAIGSEPRPYAGAVDERSGDPLSWNPRPNSQVNALAWGDQTVYLGGTFTSVWAWVARSNLAAVRVDTGQPTGWNPSATNYVTCLKVHGRSVYIAGGFSSIDGQPRRGVAAVDLESGAVGTWDPDVRGSGAGPVYALEVGPGTVYLGGLFSTVGGVPRFALAAVDSVTAEATSWQPSLDFWVYALALRGDTLFAGGEFFSINGVPRAHLVALSTTDGSVLGWQANTDGPVTVLSTGADALYVSGAFTTIGGAPRSELASVTYDNATVTAWAPSLGSSTGGSKRVLGIAPAGDVVYVGGWFDLANGQPRGHIAAFDLNGSLREWDAAIKGDVWAVAFAEGRLFAGGLFTQVGLEPLSGLANFGEAGPVPPPETPLLGIRFLAPNPTSDLTRVSFTLARAGSVSVEVFDLCGRRVVAARRDELMTAGTHAVDIPIGTLREGTYLCRVAQGGQWAAKKLTVVR